MECTLRTKIEVATIFNTLLDEQNQIDIMIDADVTSEKWYRCSDDTTTVYMKLLTEEIFHFLECTKHKITIVEGLS